MTPSPGAPRRPAPRFGALRALALAAAGALLASCASPAERPAAVAAPAPASSPAAERAYIVFFEWGSAALGPRARRIVAEAARSAGTGPGNAGRVELQAYADRSGRTDRNLRLSRRRADAVAAELARQGVRRGRISIEAHGEERAFVPTEDGAREAQNRGVWIVLR